MVDAPTIGVLSPFAGGPYFGAIIAAVARSARTDRKRVIAIQTLDPGHVNADKGPPPQFSHPVAWRHIAGFVVITRAVNERYVAAIRAAGKPVIVVGHEYENLDVPTVLSDNEGGIRAAVEHLVGHGHRDIAFAGFAGAHDTRVRREAYRHALLANGITPDPALCFEAEDNMVLGEETARLLAEASHRYTAIVTATDANGIDVIKTLGAAGLEVPERVAVFGFDDIEDARYAVPSLSSVRQSLERLGVTAYTLLAAELRGERVERGHHLVPTALAIRESCGCSAATAAVERAASFDSPRRALAVGLAEVFGLTSWVRGPDAEAAEEERLAEVVDAIAETIHSVAASGSAPSPTRLHAAFAGLGRRVPLANLEGITQVVRAFAANAMAGADGWRRAVEMERCVGDIVLKAAQARARGQFGSANFFQEALSTQYVVSMDLLRSHEKNPRRLEWLARTNVAGGCLGQWRNAEGDRDGSALEIVGSYVADPTRRAAAGGTMSVSEFPPEEIVTLMDDAEDKMVFVIPVRSAASDWGMLGVLATIESAVPSGRETVNQWGALLVVALEHEAVLRSLRDQEDRLRRVALYDELTGLPNRVLFVDRLRQAIRRMKRQPDANFAVLFLDLDGFKLINDSMGHSAGDELLVQVASRIRNGLREIDTAARFGGDEFLMLIEDLATYGSPVQVAERLHEVLTPPFRVARQDLVVSASIGIALGSAHYEEAEEVLRDADLAMYTAKSREKGSHVVFDVGMHARAVDRMRIEAELRRALEREELEVHYQPIVDLATRRACAFEALVRWRHPDRGLLAPDSFLPVAEESGMMTRIGAWVLGEACRQLESWDAAGLSDDRIRVSVNVSNAQFWHGGLLEDVEACLAKSQLDPDRLALEITEGVIMHNVDLARKLLDEVHSMGVELHIDDFGTGYSSLEALHQLPIDALKIDRSFVARLGLDSRSGEFVKTIVLMGTNLGMDLIAEGVETRSHQEHLRSMGTTYGQGYWFSRPVPGSLAGRLAAGVLPPRNAM